LDTLAAALAESGRFEDAAKMQAAAIIAAESMNDAKLAVELRDRPYAERKPYRENPTSKPATPTTTAPTTSKSP
ncbi:MAG: hypothetical protein QOF78_2929, partial [Phycisphaerales bacterium]|nr:hypothetical protein [Phycisphaerales bacterium]